MIKDKPIIVIEQETEQKTLHCLQDFAEKRTLEEHKSIESVINIFLNA